MAKPDEQVERIVHEVLARMTAAAGGRSDNPGSQNPPPSASGDNSGDLVLNDNVITAATLEDRLTGVRRVIVSARAVVTPSARDLLRDENITLSRALKSSATSAADLIVGVADVRFDVGELAKALRQHGIEIQQCASEGLAENINGIAKEINASRRGIVLTDNPAAALCLANRQRGIRAVQAANRGEVNDAIKLVGANFLVIDAIRRSKFEVQRIVEAFATSPPAQCPPQWKTWLE